MVLASVFEKTVLGIDNSTQSCAWALFKGRKLIDYGEIIFQGKNTFERLVGMEAALAELKEKCKSVDVICIEKTAFVQSKSTAIYLGMAAGAVISHIANANTKVIELAATTWQNGIGNGILTTAEKRAIKVANPGKSAAWLKNAGRLQRKQRTIDFVKKQYGVTVDNDNQSDAIALTHFFVNRR